MLQNPYFTAPNPHMTSHQFNKSAKKKKKAHPRHEKYPKERKPTDHTHERDTRPDQTHRRPWVWTHAGCGSGQTHAGSGSSQTRLRTRINPLQNLILMPHKSFLMPQNPFLMPKIRF
jgi:hypothetical protein